MTELWGAAVGTVAAVASVWLLVYAVRDRRRPPITLSWRPDGSEVLISNAFPFNPVTVSWDWRTSGGDPLHPQSVQIGGGLTHAVAAATDVPTHAACVVTVTGFPGRSWSSGPRP